MQRDYTIHIKTGPVDKHVEVAQDVLLSKALVDNGVRLDMRCRGRGTCGACRVLVNHNEQEKRPVLACQAYVADDLHIEVPLSSMIRAQGKISDEFTFDLDHIESLILSQPIYLPQIDLEDHRCLLQQMRDALPESLQSIRIDAQLLNQVYGCLHDDAHLVLYIDKIDQRAVGVQVASKNNAYYGLAVDIGTTTVVAMIVDLRSGDILARQSAYNQQMRLADDVSSRIAFCRDDLAVQQLQTLLIDETINPLINNLCDEINIDASDIFVATCAGNTVMTHLLLALDPSSMGAIPFQPLCKDPTGIIAKDLHLRMAKLAGVHVAPAISAYVGGDISAGMYVSQIHRETQTCLLVDIGTNGEMVLVDEGKMYVCSTPAGPAFEGSGVVFGCRAAPGAIESIVWQENGDLDIKVIGDVPANGICGSAYIDFIASGYLNGFIDPFGHMSVDGLTECDRLCVNHDFCRDSLACTICSIEDKTSEVENIVISEADISVILQAKAAIYSGIVTLLEHAGKSVADLDKLILAGGFAKHISKQHAIHLGMIPSLPLEKIEVVGNASLAGAYHALIHSQALDDMHDLINAPEVIELNLVPSFEDNYVDALVIPNLDAENFEETIHKHQSLMQARQVKVEAS